MSDTVELKLALEVKQAVTDLIAERDALRADFEALNEVLRTTCEELDSTRLLLGDVVWHGAKVEVELDSTKLFLQQVADTCEKAESEVLVLRKENAELFAAMMIPSYEEENRLRAELAALKSTPTVVLEKLIPYGDYSRDDAYIEGWNDAIDEMAALTEHKT